MLTNPVEIVYPVAPNPWATRVPQGVVHDWLVQVGDFALVQKMEGFQPPFWHVATYLLFSQELAGPVSVGIANAYPMTDIQCVIVSVGFQGSLHDVGKSQLGYL